jgi:ATP/maltotriose-dependent transcriptional regulator MalT
VVVEGDDRAGASWPFDAVAVLFNGVLHKATPSERMCVWDRDLLILETDMVDPPCLPLGTALPVQEQDETVTAGYPFADVAGMERGVCCFGWVARVVREGELVRHFAIQDAIAGTGHSGGPVYHLESRRVVGVVQTSMKPGMPLIGYAMPVDAVLVLLPYLREAAEAVAKQWDQNLMVAAFGSAEASYRAPELWEPPPLPPDYVERTEELRRYREILQRDRLCVIEGQSGMGKTTLGAALADAVRSSHVAVWVDFRGGPRSEDSLILQLARGAVRAGDTFLLSSVTGDTRWVRLPSASKLELIAATLRRRPYLLAFDNVHLVDNEPQLQDFLRNLRRFITNSLTTDARLLVMTRRTPPFLEDWTCDALGGFTEGEVKRYVEAHGLVLPERLFVELLAQTKGRPKYIQLAVKVLEERVSRGESPEEITQWLPCEPDVGKYLATQVLTDVSEEERKVLDALSVLDGWETPATVSAVCRVPNAAGILHDLHQRKHIVELGPSGTFALDELLRRHLYERMDNRAELHKRAGKELCELHRPFESALQYFKGRAFPEAIGVACSCSEAIGRQGHARRVLTDVLERLPLDRLAGSDRAKVALCKSEALNLLGRFAQAAREYELALNHVTSDVERSRVCNSIGDSCRLASKYAEAGRKYEQAFRLVERLDDDAAIQERGRALLGLAKILRLTGRYAEGLRKYQQARADFEAIGRVDSAARAVFGIGEIERLTGRYELALENYRLSKKMCSSCEPEDREAVAYASWGIGEALRILGDTAGARFEHELGESVCQEIGDSRSRAWAMMGLAEVDRTEGQLERALSRYAAAEERARFCGSDTEVAHARLGIAETKRLLGEADLGLYDASIQTYEERDMRHCMAVAYVGKALALRLSGQEEVASKLVDQASSIFRELGLTCQAKETESIVASKNPNELHPLNFP